jgi:hypothetical protein
MGFMLLALGMTVLKARFFETSSHFVAQGMAQWDSVYRPRGRIRVQFSRAIHDSGDDSNSESLTDPADQKRHLAKGEQDVGLIQHAPLHNKSRRLAA